MYYMILVFMMMLSNSVSGMAINNYDFMYSNIVEKPLDKWIKEAKKQECFGHTDKVNDLKFHNGLLYSGSRDCSIRVWDPMTGNCKTALKRDNQSRITTFDFVDSNTLVSDSHSFLNIWDLVKERYAERYIGHEDPIRRILCHEDKQQLIVVGGNQVISCDLRARKQVQNFTYRNFTYKGKLIDGALTKNEVVLADDNKKLIILDMMTKKIRSINGDHTGIISGLASIPNNRVVSASYDGTMRVWNDGYCVQTIDTIRPVCAIAQTSTNNLVPTGISNLVSLWNVKDKKALNKIQLSSPSSIEALALNGTHLATGDRCGSIRTWLIRLLREDNRG